MRLDYERIVSSKDFISENNVLTHNFRLFSVCLSFVHVQYLLCNTSFFLFLIFFNCEFVKMQSLLLRFLFLSASALLTLNLYFVQFLYQIICDLCHLMSDTDSNSLLLLYFLIIFYGEISILYVLPYPIRPFKGYYISINICSHVSNSLLFFISFLVLTYFVRENTRIKDLLSDCSIYS